MGNRIFTLRQAIFEFPRDKLDQRAEKDGRSRGVYLRALAAVGGRGHRVRQGGKAGLGFRNRQLGHEYGPEAEDPRTLVRFFASLYASVVEKLLHPLLRIENPYVLHVNFVRLNGGNGTEFYHFKEPGVAGAAKGIAFIRDLVALLDSMVAAARK